MNKIDYKAPPLRIFAQYLAGHKRLFFLDMGCSVCVALVDLVFPWVSRLSMYRLLPDKRYGAFFAVMALLAAAYVVKAALNYVIVVFGHRMGVLVEADMRRDIFEHMQKLSFSFYDRHRTGVLMSHITSDLFEVTELAHHGPENLLICSLTFVGSMLVMLAVNWKLALALALVITLSLWFTLAQRAAMRRANVEVKRKTADIYAAIESSISGIRTAKAFANEDRESEKFDRANALFRSAKTEYYRAMACFQSGMEFTGGIAQVVAIAVGGLLIMRGEMSYVDLITFSLYISVFISPIRRLTQFSEIYMQGMAGFGRFLEIMNTEPAVTDAPDAKELKNVRGEVEYRDVCFSYGNGVEVLKNVSFRVPPGGSLALVGPSGGGKTTLCSLLPRFYDVTAGAVLVDGQDVRSLTQESLRRPAHARRLRQLHRRARGHALGRAEAAHRHRAGLFEKPEDPRARRGDLRPRHRHRAAHPGELRRIEPRAHHHHHRAPPLHGPLCRLHRRGGGRAYRRDGQPRRAAGEKRRLRRAVPRTAIEITGEEPPC